MPHRIIVLRWLFVIIFVLLLGRLSILQVFEREGYRILAERQQRASFETTAKRGHIFLHNKESTFLAATQKPIFELAINPKSLEDKEAAFLYLNKFLDLDEKEFFAKASQDDPFEVIARGIDKDLKEKIASQTPLGVEFIESVRRFYPAGELAAHVLGFFGEDQELGFSGRYGVEQYYEYALAADERFFTADVTAGGRQLAFGNFLGDVAGADLTLTLDVQVQFFLELVLEKTVEKLHASSGGIIVLEPLTGKILAMAARPVFNPNTYFAEKALDIFSNPLMQSVFEVGSVVKPLTMVAAIDTGSVVLETTYIDRGVIKVDGHVIENFDGKARGQVNIQEILSQSLNTGAVFLAERVGKAGLHNYFDAFGLGELTGVDLTGEVPGNLANLDSPRFIESATAAFGQGIGVTPLGFTMALGALANGGLLMRPYIVEEIRYPSGQVHKTGLEVKRRVMKEETSRTVTRMLVNVVDTTLAGGKGKLPGYSMAAKTGTAQIPSQYSRGYSDDFLHSFFGYAPAFKPQFLIFMYIERPRGVLYASQSLTEPYKELMQFLLNYYEIPPDRLPS